MTPQMIRILTYFMTAVIFKESFELAGIKKAKMVSSGVLIAICLRFLFLVYRQWQYLA